MSKATMTRCRAGCDGRLRISAAKARVCSSELNGRAARAAGDRHEGVEDFPGLAQLLGLRQELHGLHVVQPVCHLYGDDPSIGGPIVAITWLTSRSCCLLRRSSALICISAISVPKSRLRAASVYGVSSSTVSCKIAAHSGRIVDNIDIMRAGPGSWRPLPDG